MDAAKKPQYLRACTLKDPFTQCVPYAVVVALFALPLGATIKSIFLLVAAGLIIASPSYRQTMISCFVKPWCIAAFLLFFISIIACFWSPASLQDQVAVLRKYDKLLYLPIFVAGFREGRVRFAGLHAFLLAMFITCCASVLKFTGLVNYEEMDLDPGVIFNNHIVTGFLMAFAAYIAVILLARTGCDKTIMHPRILSSNTRETDWDWVLDKPHPCDPASHPWLDGSKTQSQSVSRSFCKNEGIFEDKARNTYQESHMAKFTHIAGYTFLALFFSYQVLFINPGRTGYMIFLCLLVLLMLQLFTWRRAIIAIIVVTLGFGIVFSQSKIMQQGFQQAVQDLHSYKAHKKDTPVGYRMQFHKYAYQLFIRHPWLGNGTGSFGDAYHKENPVPARGPYLFEPHSQYWMIAAEFGTLGLLGFVFFLGSLWLSSLVLRQYRIMALGLLVIFIVGNVSDSLLLCSGAGYFFMVFMALCLGEGVVT